MPLCRNRKLIIMFILTFVITATPVFSNEIKRIDPMIEYIITPYFTYITSFSSDLVISSDGRANISMFVSSRNCDRIVVKAILQRYEGGSWKSIKSWSLSQSGTVALMNESYSVIKGYQYRLHSNCEVYNKTDLIESESLVTDVVFY